MTPDYELTRKAGNAICIIQSQCLLLLSHPLSDLVNPPPHLFFTLFLTQCYQQLLGVLRLLHCQYVEELTELIKQT